MSRLKNIFLPLRTPSQSHITEQADAPWSPLGRGKYVLLPELEKLYWEGVRRELENIIRTLKIWQSAEFADVCVADEEDDFVHGFDTFLDQVTEESRAFAIRYGAVINPLADRHMVPALNSTQGSP